MAKVYSSITEEIKEFIQQQKMFFVGTAPSGEGNVNVSPKGYDTFRIVDHQRVLYLDYHGSGNETANHLDDNGRITFMWCSFEEQTKIIRVYGKGKVIRKEDNHFKDLLHTYYNDFQEAIIRQIFDIQINKVQVSCGWGVPFMNYLGERPKLHEKSIKAFIK